MKKLLILVSISLFLETVNANKSNMQSQVMFEIGYPQTNSKILLKPLVSSNPFKIYAQLNDTITIKLYCAPIDYNPKILSIANSNFIHPDWKESEVGVSSSFLSTKKIINENGVFLYGNLISPRGGVLTSGCYILFSEWECSN
jgi:hypothetical protein